MIAKMGLCVLDEGVVLGTFLLIVSSQRALGGGEGYRAQS